MQDQTQDVCPSLARKLAALATGVGYTDITAMDRLFIIQVFSIPIKETRTLLHLVPLAWSIGSMLNINICHVRHFLRRHEIEAAYDEYNTNYIEHNSDASPPHPTTLYNDIERLRGFKWLTGDQRVDHLMGSDPNSSRTQSLQFAHTVSQFTQSAACKAAFPTIANVQKLDAALFTFVVVMILSMYQACDEGIHHWIFEDFPESQAGDVSR